MNKRPIGVTIFGWLLILSGIVNFLLLFLFVFSSIPKEKVIFIVGEVGYDHYDPIIWVGMFFLGRGLLRLQEWARRVIVWVSAFGALAYIIILLFRIKPLILNINIVSFIVTCLTFYYFSHSEVKKQFR